MLTETIERQYLARILHALEAGSAIVQQSAPGTFSVRDNGGRDVVTQVDRAVSDVLRTVLLKDDEGWLSEEDVDDLARLTQQVVWVVDPLDGTREFVDGIPEWSISVGLVVDGTAVAGGVCNPATNEMFLGGAKSGVTYKGRPAQPSQRKDLDGAVVLASRQEYKRGEWVQFEGKPFSIRPTGSVAYKLALVSAGLADATWTLSPKHEWDVAAGVALVNSAGGRVSCIRDGRLQFNQAKTLLPGLVASSSGIWQSVSRIVEEALVG
jgi:myo-inositol-1(or 4)-monophosphatase